MIDKKYLIGGLIGLVIGLSMIPIEAAIPPTPAVKSVSVLTDNDTSTFTDVNATVYNEQWFFVSDGSIWFNVTESYP